MTIRDEVETYCYGYPSQDVDGIVDYLSEVYPDISTIDEIDHDTWLDIVLMFDENDGWE